MDNYQASHMGNNLVAMTTTPKNYFTGHLCQDLQYCGYHPRKQHAEGGQSLPWDD